jgi:hypothetical protein
MQINASYVGFKNVCKGLWDKCKIQFIAFCKLEVIMRQHGRIPKLPMFGEVSHIMFQ